MESSCFHNNTSCAVLQAHCPCLAMHTGCKPHVDSATGFEKGTRMRSSTSTSSYHNDSLNRLDTGGAQRMMPRRVAQMVVVDKSAWRLYSQIFAPCVSELRNPT
eukprot:2248834-Amphidinium_carterae.1